MLTFKTYGDVIELQDDDHDYTLNSRKHRLARLAFFKKIMDFPIPPYAIIESSDIFGTSMLLNY